MHDLPTRLYKPVLTAARNKLQQRIDSNEKSEEGVDPDGIMAIAKNISLEKFEKVVLMILLAPCSAFVVVAVARFH